jgi:hypothetical protein
VHLAFGTHGHIVPIRPIVRRRDVLHIWTQPPPSPGPIQLPCVNIGWIPSDVSEEPCTE